MNATSRARNWRSERLPSVGLAILIGLFITAQIGTAVAAQDSSDSCASSLVGSISQTGLDVQISAPALGCRQAEDGNWYMPPISATSEGLVTQQLTIEGKVLLASVDRMSIDRAFGSSLQFSRDDSTVHIPGVGGVVSSSDVSNDDIATGPSWRNNVRNSYNQSMMVYLTRTAGTESELVFYIEWFMARRDTTLLTMVGQSNPLAATAFLDTFGYQQFPWPWQLADQAAIAAYMGQGPLDFSPEYTPAPRPTISPTSTPRGEIGSGGPNPQSTSTTTSSTLLLSPDWIQARPSETIIVDLIFPRLQGVHSVAFMAYAENIAVTNIPLYLVDGTGDSACSSGHDGDIVPPTVRATLLTGEDAFPPGYLELAINPDVQSGDRLVVCVEAVGFAGERELFAWNAQAIIEITD